MTADAATWRRCLRLHAEQRRLAPVGECELCDNARFYGQPRIGSLCTGYEGLGLAVTEVIGGRSIWLSEIDPAPAKVCEVRFPRVPNLGDLTVIDWTKVPRIDVLMAGYPCQPFSHAGKREGTNDERHLWPYIADAVRVLRPRLVILENVAGHLSLGLDVVLGDLAALGFDAEWALVRASEVGACHQRARLFIVASNASGGHPERRGGPEAVAGPVGAARIEGRGCDQGGDAAVDRGADAADTDADDLGCEGTFPAAWRHDERGDQGSLWGDYGPAIERHARVLGRPAPAPVDHQGRLSPLFVEWMMMLPAGWVTDVLPSRTKALKCLGNGVVPAQAMYALRGLLARLDERIAA